MPTALQNLSDESRDELAQLALNVANNGKTRKGFLGLVKEVNPEAQIPEIDVENRITEIFAKRDKEENERKAAEQEERLKQQLFATKMKAQEKYGLSEEHMKAMETRMAAKDDSRLPADYEFAARMFKNELDSATPTTYGASGWGPLDLKGTATQLPGIMEDEAAWSLKTAHSMIDDMQRKGGKTAF